MSLVTQISIGRFHHFNAARQLQSHGLLESIWTGYPWSRLQEEEGIPREKIHTYPWIQTPYMAKGRFGIKVPQYLDRAWARLAQITLDRHVASKLKNPGVLFALSQSGLRSGKKMQSLGGAHVCDRGSSHIRFQNRILAEEYRRWGIECSPVDPWAIEREEKEYEACDLITIPSEFCMKSFLQEGVAVEKLRMVPYGARLNRFQKIADPNNDEFTVLWVGGISIRKAFLDALHAFQKLHHPHKKLVVIGAVEPAIKKLLFKENLDKVFFRGLVPNSELPMIYSSAHVFLLSSVEEGLAVVQGEALACGCPVIATENTGASDLFDNGKEGFIVPIRRPDLIAERLQELADDQAMRKRMSDAALTRVKQIGGWNAYGAQLACTFRELAKTKDLRMP
jgi:glycosyltransferase involved in cell wall biosynthesis